MKTVVIVLIGGILTLALYGAGHAVESGTCRCNNGIASLGDAMVDVIMKCGEPTLKNQREEKRVGADKRSSIIVTIEEWSYNFGPNAFMYSMRFENGRVERIDSLDYGY